MVQFQKKISVIRVNLVIIMSQKQLAPESPGTPSKGPQSANSAKKSKL